MGGFVIFRIPPSPFSQRELHIPLQGLCPSQKGEDVTAPPVALNRFALGLTDHQRSRQFFVRDGTALLEGCCFCGVSLSKVGKAL